MVSFETSFSLFQTKLDPKQNVRFELFRFDIKRVSFNIFFNKRLTETNQNNSKLTKKSYYFSPCKISHCKLWGNKVLEDVHFLLLSTLGQIPPSLSLLFLLSVYMFSNFC
jgi:hypothetical protein